LFVCALGVAGALTSTSWNRGPEPAQQLGTDEISPALATLSASGPAENFELTGPSEAVSPELTTILLPSHSTGEDLKASSQPSSDSEPLGLVRELQRELKRVGCYAHDIDGAWTSATRKAMRDFADRVNAALPVARPETPQLVLLRSHPELVCRETCRL